MSEAMETEVLLRAEAICKAFGALQANQGISLDLEAGEIHALIGPNGAGKTTLIAQLTGEIDPDSGRIHLRDRDITRASIDRRARLGLARSFQITSVFRNFTALDNAAMGIQAREPHSFRFWRAARRDPALREPALAVLERVGLASLADRRAGELSHGDQRRLELAMALATDPLLLLLDEPLAGMGPEESLRMTELLDELRGQYGILLVEHDMDAVFKLADRITVLVEGRIIASGRPAEIRDDSAVQRAYLGESRPC
jgi:branched-chain amino acid transport system ATP-binding protein